MGLAPVPRARYWQSVCQRRSDNNVESYSAKDRYRRGDIDGVVGGPIYGACAYFHLSKVTNFFLQGASVASKIRQEVGGERAAIGRIISGCFVVEEMTPHYPLTASPSRPANARAQPKRRAP